MDTIREVAADLTRRTEEFLHAVDTATADPLFARLLAAAAQGERVTGRVHDSQAGDCLRKQWCEITGVVRTNPVDGAMIWTFAQGKLTEVMVLYALIKLGYVVGQQQQVLYDGFTVGQPDGVVAVGGMMAPVEVKHLGLWPYQRIWREGVEINPAYYAQMVCYMGKLGATEGLFVGVAQDQGAVANEIRKAEGYKTYDGWGEALNRKVFFKAVPYNPIEHMKMRSRATLLLERATPDTPTCPDAEYQPEKDATCLGCGWRDWCVERDVELAGLEGD